MTPFVSVKAPRSDSITIAAHAPAKPDLSYLPAFNVAGGRPTERRGTRGSFTPGVRIMSGGPQAHRGVAAPLTEAGSVDHGKVLFVSSVHKPDLSGEARFNVAGGRPTERLGAYPGRFAPGSKTFRGGAPRPDHAAAAAAAGPLEVDFLDDHGQVLFVSSVHKPDLSAEARYNATRPTERLGFSHGGRFTPGAARHWSGGQPRDVPRAPVRDPGTVLYRSARLAPPDLVAIDAEETNVAGGRGDERHGRMGSFEHGVVEVAGGPLHMPSCSASDLALWHEGGQKENKYRRCGPSHFVAGVSILSGGMPIY